MSLKDYLEIAGTILTLLAIIFGIVQYRKAQKWKRLEFISKEINDFENDKDVRNARFMLDWEETEVELYHEASDWKYEKRFVLVDDDMIKASLTTYENDPRQNEPYSDIEVCIRDTFDILFGYFEGFYANIKTGLVSFEEYYPHIMYWLDILSNPENKYKDDEFKKLVHEFLEYYGYAGVLWMFEEHLIRDKE